jgi:hypothetical protein
MSNSVSIKEGGNGAGAASTTIGKSIRRAASSVSHGDNVFVLILTLAFAAFALIGILNHEMWRDELQAWLIARDSSSLSDLFQNVRCEGHPALWHLCLYVLNSFTRNPIAMQLFHLSVASATVFLVAKFSPFTKLQKALFSFGYFPLYEYGVISRSYALGVLLIFSCCVLFSKVNRNYIALACLLALLSNTSAYGFIIAVAIVLTLVFECLIDQSRKPSDDDKVKILIGLFIFALGAAAFLILLNLPTNFEIPHSVSHQVSNIHIIKRTFVYTLIKIWESYFPLQNVFTYNFWNTNIFMAVSEETFRRAGALLSLGLFASSLFFFIRKPVVLFLYLCGTLGILLFTFTLFLGDIRHSGHLFIVFIACLWLSRRLSDSNLLSYRWLIRASNLFVKYKAKFLTGLLCVHFAAGVYAMSMDLVYPFSENRNTADYIKEHQMAGMLIAGSRDYSASPLTAYLDQEIYFPESGTFGTFIVWNEEREAKPPQEFLEKISELIELRDEEVLFISTQELSNNRPDINVTELARFTRSIVIGENFYLYRVRRR